MALPHFATAKESREIAFVLNDIQNPDGLAAGLPSHVQVHVLDASGDVLAQIITLLADQTGLSAIHLFGHGSAGSLHLGATRLNASNLPEFADALARIGAALSDDGDILLYGCDVAQGTAGAELIGRLAQATGADIAASTDTTGASALGGNWVLEAASGTVDVATLQVADYADVLAAPVIANFGDTITFTEGSTTPIAIDADVAFSGGVSYTGGFVRFNVSNPSSGDRFTLTSDANPDAAGAVSVDGTDVYLGTGSTKQRIGSIDATENGQDGKALKILFSTPLVNGSFEQGPAGNSVPGFVLYNQRYGDNGTEINFRGYTIPLANNTDGNSIYTGGTGTVKDQIPSGAITMTGSVQAGVGTGGSQALYLSSNGYIVQGDSDPWGSFQANGYGSIQGPYAVSANPFYVEAGDSIKLDFKAVGSQDDYQVFGLLRKVNPDGSYVSSSLADTGADATKANVVLFAERGADTGGFKTVTKTGLEAGSYKFEFIGGTYDGTGGLAVGSHLYVDNIRLIPATTVDDSVLSKIALQVQFLNDAPDTVESRTLTVSAQDSDGAPATASKTLLITQDNNSPIFTGPAFTPGGGSENDVVTVPRQVADWFNSLFSDPDNTAVGSTNTDSLAGIVIVSNPTSPAEGKWVYSTNSTNGTDGDWRDVGAASSTAGLALDKDAWLKFVPEAAYAGGPGAGVLRVHAVDDKAYAQNGTVAPAFTTGDGSTRVTYDTTADDNVRSSVAKDATALYAYATSANDAPVATATIVNAGTVGEHDNGSTPARANAGVTATALYDLAGGTDEDSDTRDTPIESYGKGVAIYDITDAAGGKFQYSTNGGTTWTDIPAVSETGALLLGPNDKIRYVSDGDVGDVGTFKYYLWDGVTGSGTAGAANANVETANRGGGTGFSANGATASITVVDKVYHPETIPSSGIPSKNTTGPGVHTSGPLFVDPDGGTMAFTATLANGDPLPDWLSIDPATGILSGNPPADQTLSIKVTVTDDASDTQDATFSWTFANTIDPLNITTATDTGADDLITRHPNPVLEFDAAAGATIVLKGPDGTPLTQGTHYSLSNVGGKYSLTLLDADGAAPGNQPFGAHFNGAPTSNPASTGDGIYQILSNGSAVGSFTLDTTPPVTPTVNQLTADVTKPVLTGTVTLGAGETLSVTINGATYNNVPVLGGAWSVDTNTAVPSSGALGAFVTGQAYNVDARVIDSAGNTSSDGTSGEFRKYPPLTTTTPALTAPIKSGDGNIPPYTVPAGTFTGGSSSLTYSAGTAPAGGGAGPTTPLPGWLVFDPVTQTFSGNPPADATSPLVVRVTSTDSAGNQAYSDLTFTFSNTNDIPSIAGIPAGPGAAPYGAISALPDYRVLDGDNDVLTVTIATTNGSVTNVVDADPLTPGVQITGRADDINAALAAMQFVPDALGLATMQLSVTDGVIASPITAIHQFNVVLEFSEGGGNGGGGGGNGGGGTTPPADDNDGIPPAAEAEAPPLVTDGKPAQKGDGNGDGIADSAQSSVSSTPFLRTDKAVSNPGNAPQTFITLVANSDQGRVGSEGTAQITSLTQGDHSAQLPSSMASSLGSIASTIALTGNPAETFSLYVDSSLPANGFWVQDNQGTWVNLASAAYGGRVVAQGNKLRLDFQITDGGAFDRDGKADGVITLQGEIGQMPLTIVGYAPETTQGGFWF
ncbi:DUF4347 domain-containing protein [Comamonas granuli]|uniref:DUF4347 domain-containing protein n=1 Tax=Comamonas granuli TaxID=290309 RepID=UPI0005A77A16|nr:DUF4347 domain-containing protein [Comamonas granuli]